MSSAVAGYLIPAVSPAPLEDDALIDFLGNAVAGITGLDRNENVRPRWQEDPPNLPARTVTWCAIGVVNVEADTYAATPDSRLIRHETITVVASFYGPQSAKYAAMFRDGLLITQNQEIMVAAGFGHLDATGPLTMAELIKEKWLQRQDITWRLRREIVREYDVLDVLSADGVLFTDIGETPITTPVVFGVLDWQLNGNILITTV